MHKTDQLIGAVEAAKIAGVDRATFNRWVAAGKIAPKAALPGRTGARLYGRSDVENLVARLKDAS